MQIAPTNSYVRDNTGKSYSITSPKSFDELRLPEGLGLDYRVVIKDTDDSRSCLEKIALDPESSRSQIFLIKDNDSVIGLATLLSTPHKYFYKMGYLKLVDGKLILKSFSELFNPTNAQSFVIELGWFLILPSYRGKKLAKSVLTEVLVPTIRALVRNAPYEIFITCSARGDVDSRTSCLMRQKWETHLTGGTNEVTINDLVQLGKVHPESKFTATMAKMQLTLQKDVFALSQGPVFLRRLSEEDKKTE